MAKAKGNGGALVPWQEQLAKEAAEAAKVETVSTKSISFKSGVLSFDGNAIPGNKINVVVLDWAFLNAWYPNAFDAQRVVSPSCYAISRTETDLAPHPDGEDRQGDDEGLCLNCKQNAWGSDPDGGKGKACKNQRRLSMISADTLNTGEKGILAAETVIATLPVTSVKNWSQFVIQIANVVKRPPYGVVAEMSVVPDQRTQFQVKWTFVDTVADALVPALMSKRKAMADSILFSYPKNEVAPPPAKAAPKGQPAKRRF